MPVNSVDNFYMMCKAQWLIDTQFIEIYNLSTWINAV